MTDSFGTIMFSRFWNRVLQDRPTGEGIAS